MATIAAAEQAVYAVNVQCRAGRGADLSKSPPQPLPFALILWAVGSVALNIGLHRFTFGVTVPSLRRDLGIDYLASGTLNAVHMAGYLVGTLTAPRLVARLGLRRMARLAHLFIAAGALVCALAPLSPGSGFAVLAAGRLATGFGAGVAVLCVFVVALGAVPAARRPLVSAVAWGGMGLAIVGSGLAISLLLGPPVGWRTSFALAALLALVIAVFIPRSGEVADPPAAAAAPFSLAAMASARWLYLVGAYFMFGAGYIAFSTFAGARMAAADASELATGAMWVAFGLASMVGAGLTILVLNSPRLKPSALALAMGLGALGSALSVAGAAAAAVAGALLVGLGLAAVPSIVSAHARERSSAADYARAFSLATAALGLGQFTGPVAAGALADHLGTVAAPAFAAAAYGLGTVLALCDMRAMRTT